MQAVFACNQYVDEQAPWALRKTDPGRMQTVLLTLFKALRDLGIAIQPVVPERAASLLDQLGVPANARSYSDLEDGDWYDALVAASHTIAKPEPVFPRLELPEEEKAA